MVRNEGRAFLGALLATLDATLPLENGPAFEVVLRKLGKDRREVHLTIARRAKTPRSRNPGLVSAVHALASRGPKLSVFDVEHFDSGVIEVDECEIVELLQHEVARIKQDVAAPVSGDTVEKHFKADTVVEIFAGMDFKAEIDAGLVECVENGLPTFRQLVKCSVDQAGGTLRPWVDVGPSEGARKCDMRSEPKIGRSFGSMAQLFDRPLLAR